MAIAFASQKLANAVKGDFYIASAPAMGEFSFEKCG